MEKTETKDSLVDKKQRLIELFTDRFALWEKIPIEDLFYLFDQNITAETAEDLRANQLRGLENVIQDKESRAKIYAAMELGSRIFRNYYNHVFSLCSIIPFVRHFTLEDKEYQIVISLNSFNDIIKIDSKGGKSSKRVQYDVDWVKSVLEANNAKGFLLGHNHPGRNEAKPSNPDKKCHSITKAISKSTSIPLFDEFILANQTIYSFNEDDIIVFDPSYNGDKPSCRMYERGPK